MPIQHARKATLIRPLTFFSPRSMTPTIPCTVMAYSARLVEVTVPSGTELLVEHYDPGIDDGEIHHRAYIPCEGGHSTIGIAMPFFTWLPGQPPIIAENE